jgi:hypothetical protein
MKTGRALLFALPVCGLIGLACNQILGSDSYRVVSSDGGTADGGCTNPAGFGGKGCYSCPAVNREEWLNACTDSTCSPFDNARVTRLLPDGSLPDLPPAPVPDAGGSDAGSDDGGVTDAGSSLPPCSGLANPVFVGGSSAVKSFLAQAAVKLGGQPTVVFLSVGSCVGVSAMLNNDRLNSVATYWDPAIGDPALAEKQCALDPGGALMDVGVSDVFATTCQSLPLGLPSNIGDYFGPVQVMTVVTSSASAQKAVSAEALYLIFGFGDQSGVAPWVDPAQIFVRSASSGTQNMIAAAIAVPAGRWRGKAASSSDEVKNSILAVPTADAEKSLGILSADVADDFRGQLQILAYQDYRQSCGFWPDSTPTSKDKQNVRDGHYPIWGPLHFLARLNPQGVPVHAGAQTLIGVLTGTSSVAGLNVIQLYALRHLVPQCAMKVSRTGDGSPLSASKRTVRCDCYFDSLVTGKASCKSCAGSSECPAESPNCSFNFCEP